jgi:hypothetical protein
VLYSAGQGAPANQHELNRGVDDQDGPDSSLPYFNTEDGAPTAFSIAQQEPSELDTHIETLVSIDVLHRCRHSAVC